MEGEIWIMLSEEFLKKVFNPTYCDADLVSGNRMSPLEFKLVGAPQPKPSLQLNINTFGAFHVSNTFVVHSHHHHTPSSSIP